MANSVVSDMLEKYEIRNMQDRKNALKEIIQETVLCGLSKSDFFDKAVFYGGTALRIYHKLDRFSEDLDFSLKQPDSGFRLENCFAPVLTEAESLGLELTLEDKRKTTRTLVQTAYLRGNARELLRKFFPDEYYGQVPANEVLKVKIETDTAPSAYAVFERKYRFLPDVHEVCLYDLPSLFSGKICALLCRDWKGRTKGRDLYDYVFFLREGVKLNLPYLRERLTDLGYITKNALCGIRDIKRMLIEKFETIDYAAAADDAKPFVSNASLSSLRYWSKDFFTGITEDYPEEETEPPPEIC